MKNKKERYSLTAKERKAMRRAEQGDGQKESAPQEGEGQPLAADAGDEVAAPAQRKLWIPITGAVAALLLILTAVLLLVLVPRSSSRYPRAVIELNDGRKLTLTLWEESCPIAATNFIFLSKIGFFTYNAGGGQGSLIYDVQEDHRYMRFGAYYDYDANATRYKQESFLNGIPRKMFNVINVDPAYENQAASNKFGYRLRKDTGTDKDLYYQKYVLSFNSNNAADFVINMGDNNRNFSDKNGQNDMSSNLVAFGMFEDEASQKILDDIFAMEKNENTGISGAVGTAKPVRIAKISFRNLSKKKWKNFEFIKYMLTAYDGSSAFSRWVG